MNFVGRFLIVSVFLTLPAIAFAQEATLTGTVTDATGGVLPGVTVTAVNEATGNTFTAVTDDLGIYRIPVRVGAYRITVELSGFSTVSRTGVQRLVGQTASIKPNDAVRVPAELLASDPFDDNVGSGPFRDPAHRNHLPLGVGSRQDCLDQLQSHRRRTT